MTDHPPGFTIAVVDDDRRILESLKNLLESADYGVRSFASAAALLESDCLAEIDCLISDIDMPVMDGFELLRAAHAARPELPVILITGYSDLDVLKEFNDLRIILKPFTEDDLVNAIGAALK